MRTTLNLPPSTNSWRSRFCFACDFHAVPNVTHLGLFLCTLAIQPPPTRGWLRLASPNTTQPTGIFTVMNYNILCDKYATRHVYGYCPSWALNWEYRRKHILDELRLYAADIIALQVSEQWCCEVEELARVQSSDEHAQTVSLCLLIIHNTSAHPSRNLSSAPMRRRGVGLRVTLKKRTEFRVELPAFRRLSLLVGNRNRSVPSVLPARTAEARLRWRVQSEITSENHE